MLAWLLIFLISTIVAAVFGFGWSAIVTFEIVEIMLMVAAVLCLVTTAFWLSRRRAVGR